ncbi:GntR family transcriptional regulator [Desulfosporosinus hippei]|uniref:DNA-binding transcriptional regulator YhcF, GntR family n=1 Tax=Desulfosporosinus hippei DSM 8344 TaxID=1121419 RepID=A0A1G7RK58_9FIRM|nr:GntR family transcriptional regulator [Desulfosporosinus hippei]SDG11138.1 DNA-binding transcriptional regulator YhcF, GntR family [Desulfosporosinus hippei DSM 8344]
MILNTDSIKPIYLQIAEWLEVEILNNNIQEDERIYSQYQLADMFTINPATAAKGLNLLADENIVYKKRGLGMFVSPNAKQFILTKRRKQVLEQMIKGLVVEAKRLDVSENELIKMIQAFKPVGKEEEHL